MALPAAPSPLMLRPNMPSSAGMLSQAGMLPQANMQEQYFSHQYYAPSQMPTGAAPGMYQPQAYMPIYIPVLLQPQTIQIPQMASYPTFAPHASGGSGEIFTGRIKFFDNTQNYGFFVLDCNGSDLFVHYDDFLKSGITKEYIHMAKAMNTRFAFRRVSYYGKYSLSSKAVDIQLIQGGFSNESQ